MINQILNFKRKEIYWIIGLLLFCSLFLSCSGRKTEVIDTIQESEHLIQAKEVFLQGDWDKVIQYGEEGIEKDPEDGILIQLLFSAYILKGDDFYKKAVELAIEKKILSEKKENFFLNWAEDLAKNHSQNSYAHYCLSRAMGMKKKAIGPLKKAIEINPQFSEAYARLGMIFEDKKSWDKAEFYLKKALENSQNSEAINLWRLSNMYLSSKKYKLAESYALKAIEKKDDFEMAYLTLGSIYARMDELGKAINSWKEFVRLDPEEKIGEGVKEHILLLENTLSEGQLTIEKIIVNRNKALILIEALLQGDWNKVIEYGEKEIEKEPENVILCHLLSSAYWFGSDRLFEKYFEFTSEKKIVFEKRDFGTKNLNWAQKLSKKYPQNYYALLYLGCFNKEIKNNKEAIIFLEKAIEINPQLYEGYYDLGCIYLNKKSWKKSEHYLRKAVEHTKKAKGKCFLQLSTIYAKLKEYDLALDYLLRAQEKMPEYSGVYMGLAARHFNKGDLKTAKDYWEKVIQLNPDGEDGRRAREVLFELSKRRK